MTEPTIIIIRVRYLNKATSVYTIAMLATSLKDKSPYMTENRMTQK